MKLRALHARRVRRFGNRAALACRDGVAIEGVPPALLQVVDPRSKAPVEAPVVEVVVDQEAHASAFFGALPWDGYRPASVIELPRVERSSARAGDWFGALPWDPQRTPSFFESATAAVLASARAPQPLPFDAARRWFGSLPWEGM